MINSLYLPELREMLAEADREGLREFCTTLHPMRTVEFMEGLDAMETWQVLQHADLQTRVELFGYTDELKQIEIAEKVDREEFGELVGSLPSDDRVDLLKELPTSAVDALMPLLPLEERRDIQRLIRYPEETAGSIMTTDLAKVGEDCTVGEAFAIIGRDTEELETVYYTYVVDEDDHLRGLLSARELVSHYGRPDTLVSELMTKNLITVDADADQEAVAETVAKYDLIAIPVVDQGHHLLGIITHDDVIDVVREEAMEDAHRIGAVDPLEDSYLETPIPTLVWKRGMWLTILFVGALLTAIALQKYEDVRDNWLWLGLFVPLVISSGGNSGSQSATLIISALTAGHVRVRDWWQIVSRELLQGAMLGAFLALIGYGAAVMLGVDAYDALVLPITLMLVVVCGTLAGSVLPLLFRRLGWDPAMMSTPFVAGIIDLVGILIYMEVAILLLSRSA